MRYNNLSSLLFNTPLAIEKNKLQSITSFFVDRNGYDSHDAAIWGKSCSLDLDEPKERKPFVKVGDTAIIPIIGSLVHRAGSLDASSGLTSYQWIKASLVMAAQDSSVSKILLDIDSGGGSVSGLFDLVDFIRSVNAEKPVFAFSNENAFSAAYAIASAASSVFVSRTSGVGSIGVIAQHVDISKANEMDGIKITPVFAGDKKIDLSPDFPISDDAKMTLQNEVDNFYNIFIETVATNRNIPENVVRDTQAGLFFGQDAVQIGLADDVSSFDEVLEEITSLDLDTTNVFINEANKEINNMSILGKIMNKQEEETVASEEVENLVDQDVAEELLVEAVEEVETDGVETASDSSDESLEEVVESNDVELVDLPLEPSEIAAKAFEAGQSHLTESLIKDCVTESQLQHRLDTSSEIKKLCEMAGAGSKAESFIVAGASVQDVKNQLWESMAAKSELSDVSTTQSVDDINNDIGQEMNAIQKDVQRRLDESKKTN